MSITEMEPELKSSALDLLTEDEVDRVARLVVRDNEGVESHDMAVEIIDEALKFMAAAAKNRTKGRKLRPSRVVDMGWHALILHTEINARVCGKLGRFIHHRPEGPETLRRDATALDETMAAMRDAGYEPREFYWGTRADTEIRGGDCMHSECTGDGGCTAPQALPL